MFGALPDEVTRARAWRLLSEEEISELEKLLIQHKILTRHGTLNKQTSARLGWAWETPEDWEHDYDPVYIATEQAVMDFSNSIVVRRVGWFWSYSGYLDGIDMPLESSTTPVSMKELIEIIESTGLTDHFHEQGESVLWQSDFYPELETYYEMEDQEWRADQDEEDEEDDGR